MREIWTLNLKLIKSDALLQTAPRHFIFFFYYNCKNKKRFIFFFFLKKTGHNNKDNFIHKYVHKKRSSCK